AILALSTRAGQPRRPRGLTVVALLPILTVCRAISCVCRRTPVIRSSGGISLPEVLVPGRERVSFAKLEEVLPLPDLVGVQRTSFDWLLSEGVREVLQEVSPITDF